MSFCEGGPIIDIIVKACPEGWPPLAHAEGPLRGAAEAALEKFGRNYPLVCTRGLKLSPLLNAAVLCLLDVFSPQMGFRLDSDGDIVTGDKRPLWLGLCVTINGCDVPDGLAAGPRQALSQWM
jgi:hypothetical protein